MSGHECVRARKDIQVLHTTVKKPPVCVESHAWGLFCAFFCVHYLGATGAFAIGHSTL